jgi:cellobiose phosphorylase
MFSLTGTSSDHETSCAGQYGRFEDFGRTFVITDPATPTPWVNVMANERYGTVVSQAGSGYSWYENSQIHRLNRWENDLIQDRQGRYLYIQDLESGDLWSTTYQPTLVKAAREEIRHSIGSTTYIREVNLIRSEQTVFVPLDETCEVWKVSFTNLSTRARKLRWATYLEWFLGAAGEFHREFFRLFIETQSVGNVQIAWRHPGLIEDHRGKPEVGPTAFVGVVGTDVAHWMSGKTDFLGVPARLDQPGALVKGEFPKGTGRWEDPCSSAIGDLELDPGQTVSFVVVIGAAGDATQALKLAQEITLSTADKLLEKVTAYWTDVTERTVVRTDDPGLDVMANTWLKYQALCGRMTARSAYYQQGGAYGFRDQLQDSLSLLNSIPERTKKQILIHAEATYEDGGVRHWWHPNTQIFAESRHSDTCLWLSYGTLAYLDETNDLKTLETTCRYLSRETQRFGESGTLLDHCFRGIQRALDRRSPRGLPLIQAGDWNDGLSHAGIDGKGESVWVGMFLYDILNRFVPILTEIGLTDKAAEFAKEAASLAFAVNEYGWDGDWYLEGTADDGRPLGGKENTSGQLYLNPQTWALITGIAPADRAKKAMQAVKDRLIKDYGVLLLAPAYSTVDPWVGYITRYAPGSRENGGVYSHASTWAVQALALAGDHDLALKVYKDMLPSLKKDRDHYAAEPYVMPGNVDGPDSPLEGRAGWTWYTGSAAWMVRMAYDWLCGVRATREGLVVSEHAPLKDFKLRRAFRGDVFEFHASQGSEFKVSTEDGVAPHGLLKSTGSNQTHKVQIFRA